MKWLLFSVLVFGCTRPAIVPWSTSGVDPKYGASLTVTRTRQSSQNLSQSAGPGEVFILADITLSNGGSTLLPLDESLFSVVIPQGLAVRSSGSFPGCGGADLAGGHAVSCELSFQLPLPGLTEAILYKLPDGTVLRAPVSTTPCERCGSDRCVDMQTDASNCGACGRTAQICDNGVASCGAGYALCATGCALTSDDPRNCGACGNQCPAGATCVNGACHVEPCAGSADRNSCLSCCQNANPAGSAFYTQKYQACLCTSPGDCGVDCAQDFCVSGVISDVFCQLCIQQSTCDPTHDCKANAGCSAYLDCAGGCPSS